MTKILILSDLHIEALDMALDVEGRRIDDGADVVALAGDIHVGVRGLIWARRAFPEKRIVMVLGNHEFYRRYWNKNVRKMREKATYLGIDFLENNSVEIGGVRFLGCTLWTDYCLYGEGLKHARMDDALRLMEDYRSIKLDREPGANADWKEFRVPNLVPQVVARRHAVSAQWLDQQLGRGDPAKTVVVTHHAPLGASIPKEFLGDKLSPAYASNLVGLVGRSKLWVHGHVHESMDYNYGDTRILCNPRGYYTPSGKHMNRTFQPSLIVEV